MATKSSASRIALGDEGFGAAGVYFDQRRTRTAWFEGQLVTADQFNRDQSYHVTRQADLGRTVGRGVVEGFGVTAATDSETVVLVAPGLGLAASGEIVNLPEAARIDLAEIPVQRRLDALLNGKGEAGAPPETRTGLFVLAASTVEYSSNPIASYPVSATSSRSLEDSIINEAVLFTLTPFPVPGTGTESGEWRASAAHRIFMENAEPSLPPGSLALAMLALVGNRVLWVDVPMVRRACAPASGDVFGLGLVDESRRIAHFEQFEGVIGPVIAGSTAAALPASSLVRSLPAMGRLPTGSVALRAGAGEPERLSQNWLPAAVPVELVALPQDEVEALLRESVQLPPIDLGAAEAVLKNTPVSVVVPVPRADWASTPAEVAEAALPLVPPPAVGGAPSDPAAILDALLNGTPAPAAGDTMLTAAWRTLLGRTSFLWYVRRRQFQRSDDAVSGVLVTLPAAAAPPADGGTPGSGSETGAAAAISAAAKDMAEEAGGALKPLFSGSSLERPFELIFGLPMADRLRVLMRQQGLRAAGADTAALALAFDATRGDMAVDEALKRYPLEAAAAYAEVEPAMLGAGARLRVSPGRVPTPAARLVSDFGGITQPQALAALRAAAPLHLASEKFADPDTLREVVDRILGDGIDARFVALADDAEAIAKARTRLIGATAMADLFRALGRTDPGERMKLLPALRKAHAVSDEPKEVAEAMRDALGGYL